MEWDWNPASFGAIATAVASIGTLIVLYFIRRTADDARKGLKLAEEEALIALQMGRATARLNVLSTLITYYLGRAERGGPRESDFRTKANGYADRLESFLDSLPVEGE